MYIFQTTLPQTNIARENRPSQKETSIPTIHFQGRLLLVSGRVPCDFEKYIIPANQKIAPPRTHRVCPASVFGIPFFGFGCVHPWRLTWNIIMEVWKIIFLYKWVIYRFHVNLPGCKKFWFQLSVEATKNARELSGRESCHWRWLSSHLLDLHGFLIERESEEISGKQNKIWR